MNATAIIVFIAIVVSVENIFLKFLSWINKKIWNHQAIAKPSSGAHKFCAVANRITNLENSKTIQTQVLRGAFYSENVGAMYEAYKRYVKNEVYYVPREYNNITITDDDRLPILGCFNAMNNLLTVHTFIDCVKRALKCWNEARHSSRIESNLLYNVLFPIFRVNCCCQLCIFLLFPSLRPYLVKNSLHLVYSCMWMYLICC